MFGKLFLFFGTNFFFLILFYACVSKPDIVDSKDVFLTKEKGIYYYNADIYSGIIQEKFDNGNLLSEMNIVNGIKDGISRKWWPNGNLKSESNFENGEYHGTVSVFFENGKTFSIFNYEHGHESGSQQMWKSDGRLKVNYEVVNGRKYGLTGVKNCINVFDDEGHN